MLQHAHILAGVSCVGKTTIGAELAAYLAPIQTPELCKVPGLQCIMAAAHVRLNEARGCSTLRLDVLHCVRHTGAFCRRWFAAL